MERNSRMERKMKRQIHTRRASWWLIGRQRLSPVAQAELARIKAILAGGGNA